MEQVFFNVPLFKLEPIFKRWIKEAQSEISQQTTPKEDETIYGLQGLADFLGVGITTAWHIKNSGQIPYYQAGKKKIYFKASEILAATAKKKGVRNE